MSLRCLQLFSTLLETNVSFASNINLRSRQLGNTGQTSSRIHSNPPFCILRDGRQLQMVSAMYDGRCRQVSGHRLYTFVVNPTFTRDSDTASKCRSPTTVARKWAGVPFSDSALDCCLITCSSGGGGSSSFRSTHRRTCGARTDVTSAVRELTVATSP